MNQLMLLLAAAALAIATPAAAQTMGPMPGMNMPSMSSHARAQPRPRPHVARAPAARATPAGRRASSSPSRRHVRPAHPAATQTHEMSSMPGMAMPAGPAPAGQPAHDMSSMPGMQMPGANPTHGQPAHDIASMPGMSMPGQDMSNMAEESADPPAAPPPPGALRGPAYAADTVFSPGQMSGSRIVFQMEHGSIRTFRLLVDQLEARIQHGRTGYAWDAEAWYGGAINRLWVKTEGEGSFGHGPDRADVQAVFSHAVDPWFNLQAGVRYDLGRAPRRGYLVLGFEGLAPYWIEVEGFAYLSDKGDVSARFQGEYEQRITQRLILQPRLDVDIAAQNVPEARIGSGLSSAEAGLRLRYEIVPEFGPYIGVHYSRAFGNTARFRRAAGEDLGGWSFLVGVRTWF